jgi:ABC-2 type transport system ATP-binding protein
MSESLATDDNAVVIQDIRKTFRLPHEDHSGLKQILLGLFRRNRKNGYETQEVLKGVSFEVKKGEFFGIVGRNGSGKSTLLKLLAGIYTPDSGGILINGSLVPFIELGVGFNPELTGRENVFLNGALIGFSKSEMEAMYDDIVEFAELERFMDQKLKNYSSGMQVRLAFSIAIRAESDILLLDEVLAVGDEAFQRKCEEFFKKVRDDKTKTIILVTHSMESVRRYCDRAVLIMNGEVVSTGNADEVADQYSVINRESNKDIQIIKQDNSVDMTVTPTVSDDNIKFTVGIKAKKNIKDAVFALSLQHERLGLIFWANYEGGKKNINLNKGESKRIVLEIDNIFPTDNYFINANLRTDDASLKYGSVDMQFFHNKRSKKYDRTYSFLPKMKWSD